MTTKSILALALLLCLTPTATTLAQAGDPAPTHFVDAAERKAVITALSKRLRTSYVFPDVATRLANSLTAREAAGDYASATDADALARALSKDLRELGKDDHFQVGYHPQFKPVPGAKAELPSREEVASMGYGVQRVERLPGNVGYVELRVFGPTEFVADAYSAAIGLLAGSDALILDLRRNGGGEPESVAWLMSHFFAEGDARHLNDIYSRPEDESRQYWTNPAAKVRYLKPVYVLTSARTFSGGEEAAYDFQTQKRATLVGEATGGGSNPGEMFAIAHGFAAFIPTGRAINPVTKTNWEHTGVKPDISVPAADAQKVAHAAILTSLIAASKNADEVKYLRHTLAQVESGAFDPPSYAPPH